ncbi:MAG TPA: hypothetical protein VFQ61_33045 [Polyangiaceae bacterium]|nr:hypothetical protein [Polyangiaceae bacterium]
MFVRPFAIIGKAGLAATLAILVTPAIAQAQSTSTAVPSSTPAPATHTTGGNTAGPTATSPRPGDDLSTNTGARTAPAEALPVGTREALAKGDAAALARDYAGAISAYQEAIRSSPQSALSHYRMGQAQVLAGQQKEAELSYAAAVRFSGKNLNFRRKVLFCLADLAERQKNLALALERYSALASEPVSGEPEMPFASSAIERKKRLLEIQQLTADSAQVKARIEKRLKEVEAAGATKAR